MSASSPAPSDSPHPRGWTGELPQLHRPGGGFPAPAGMDPAARQGRRRRRRIPRTRGDGPIGPTSSVSYEEDSPHPRGWTPADAELVGVRQGFPAPAGMDPCAPAPRRRPPGIPRTRGDGPPLSGPTGPHGPDSPHPRGWTLDGWTCPVDVGGFPAPAGMDPTSCSPTRTIRRIPRTRGDGPEAGPNGDPIYVDSPHPRGWTRRRPGAVASRGGFPAPAGMDPPEAHEAGAGVRIPRTRGDGPYSTPGSTSFSADSPHPRGWTPLVGRHLRCPHGFPAPAGMDPAGRHQDHRPTRIPRTRGDGPSMSDLFHEGVGDSPHPRGWTRGGWFRPRSPTGFPAPAGMDPSPGGSATRSCRIPRTRGDGPPKNSPRPRRRGDSPHPRGWTRASGGRVLAGRGFPAPAGMDPATSGAPSGQTRIPRTRGDGPRRVAELWEEVMDSPHPRGWTHVLRVLGRPRRGFPAPAGMDPGRSGRPRRRRRIPRTRGDGPGMSVNRRYSGSDSPHPRGWTRYVASHRILLQGFPAPAGMDPLNRLLQDDEGWIPRTRGDGPD